MNPLAPNDERQARRYFNSRARYYDHLPPDGKPYYAVRLPGESLSLFAPDTEALWDTFWAEWQRSGL